MGPQSLRVKFQKGVKRPSVGEHGVAERSVM